MSTPVKISKEENDPICLRASIGGSSENGFYCVYRGDRLRILNMLTQILKAFETYMDEPEKSATPHSVKIRFGGS